MPGLQSPSLLGEKMQSEDEDTYGSDDDGGEDTNTHSEDWGDSEEERGFDDDERD